MDGQKDRPSQQLCRASKATNGRNFFHLPTGGRVNGADVVPAVSGGFAEVMDTGLKGLTDGVTGLKGLTDGLVAVSGDTGLKGLTDLSLIHI